MGLTGLLRALFGGGRNVVAETAEVFRVNAEAQAQRGHEAGAAALAQFAAEFGIVRRTWFDALIDGVNRLPRPFMAFGTLGLFVAAMVDPVWFAARMVGLQPVPEPLWYILGAIVAFYFGSRELHYNRTMRVTSPEAVVQTVRTIREIEAIGEGTDPVLSDPAQPDPAPGADNPALAAWLASHPGKD
jgi:hypothetical protein